MTDFAGALGDVAYAAGEHEEQCGEDDFKYATTGEFCPFDAGLRSGVIFARFSECVGD
ncbi:hypothetical protein [Cellvibrio sp. QJXJ]|uniref:hypothetical protein n=1 Tax=Cellvibrio sp. QJXJ TaxID=2964606 RepID=UPI0021C39083|nr:hypothetical protein [Cellvibrio sp. QJXJ]UUA71082.1 hypothetical protein NNX04_11725 [Cellvibrio sp. QJXJ]